MIVPHSIQQMQKVFPKSLKYEIDLIKEKSVGGNVLFSLEALSKLMDLQPGMKVLDLGCGKALSSVFLSKEFGVTVWAVDNFFSVTENHNFIKDLGLANKVFPLALDARKLPFADNFFDCIVVVNSYYYFGTDDKYLPYISKFLKHGGQIGIFDICTTEEIEDVNKIPDVIKHDYYDYWYFIHSVNWWKNKWEKTALVSINTAARVSDLEYDIMREAYINMINDISNEAFAKALLQNPKRLISFFSLIATRSNKVSFIQDSF